jgi:hypothetical protein
VLLAEFIHCCVDHSYLWCVAVNDGNLPAVLDEVCDHFCSALYGFLLFRKIGSHIFMADGHDDPLFCHNAYLTFQEIFLTL